MKTSAQGLKLIKEFEGLRLTAYYDVVGVLTIGYGHTGDDVYVGQTITEQQAEQLLQKDLNTFEQAVNKLISINLNQNQFDALVDFTYNLGIGAFGNSTLLKKLNAGDYEGAADELLRWDKDNGKRVAGLARRRKDERALYLS